MKIIMPIVIGLVLNMIIGAIILVSIDKDKRLYAWYESCPAIIAPVVQPLILMFWPFVVLRYFFGKS
jgi:hypothetical protein